MKHIFFITSLLILSTIAYGQGLDEKEIKHVVLTYHNAIRYFDFEKAGHCITDESFDRLIRIEKSLIDYPKADKQEAETYIKKLKHEQYDVVDITMVNYREAHAALQIDDDRKKKDHNMIRTHGGDYIVVKKQRGKWLVSLIDEVALLPCPMK